MGNRPNFGIWTFVRFELRIAVWSENTWFSLSQIFGPIDQKHLERSKIIQFYLQTFPTIDQMFRLTSEIWIFENRKMLRRVSKVVTLGLGICAISTSKGEQRSHLRSKPHGLSRKGRSGTYEVTKRAQKKPCALLGVFRLITTRSTVGSWGIYIFMAKYDHIGNRQRINVHAFQGRRRYTFGFIFPHENTVGFLEMVRPINFELCGEGKRRNPIAFWHSQAR